MHSLLALLAPLALAAPILAADVPFRVYVYTAPSQFVDADQKAREQAVADLQKRLAKKKKTLRVAATKDQAQITIEVIGREMADTGSRAQDSAVLGPVGDTHAIKTERITVLLHVGTYTTQMTGQTPATPSSWPAPELLAKQIENWAYDNRDRLPE